MQGRLTRLDCTLRQHQLAPNKKGPGREARPSVALPDARAPARNDGGLSDILRVLINLQHLHALQIFG